ncbi:uncharacterized protein LOC106469936 [Limulus polyphemus]|uniref:Uncharacterized protein LOC106469936 n=1 Tax=Limulus polyphemus TaxID=6850 RepID=A0ABM1BP38_LIMPO|nr:uncharacterized protein LOC106469936 [Limulus polyphemus]XP_022254217.1 uncharacterized protein LOC106469936 [Limulus polyphemus]
MWESLPDVLLEDIFSRVSISDRYSASQVCRNWYRIFYSPRVWHVFVLSDRILTRRKYNYYTGYQHILDHHRTQICLNRVGRNFRKLIFEPMCNFFNLYEFMNMLSFFCEYFDENPLGHIHTLDFSFACHLATERSAQECVFGTGGKLLQALKRLMKNLTGLRRISLRDLLLDPAEAMFLLDDVVSNCGETIHMMRLVNCTKEPYPILHVGVFLNIWVLEISPQQIDADVIILLSHTSLRDLYLVQNKYTDMALAVPVKAWRECRCLSPKLRVHLVVEGKVKQEVVWQEGANVISIVYNTPYNQVAPESALMAATLYPKELEVYGFTELPRFYMQKSFMDRADSALVLMSRSCPRLHTLIIRERISTSTLLLIAFYGRSLRRMLVRRNAIIKRCDWPKNPEWSTDFYLWLRHAAQSYETTANEISQMLNCRWAPLSDQEFKTLDFYSSHYVS